MSADSISRALADMNTLAASSSNHMTITDAMRDKVRNEYFCDIRHDLNYRPEFIRALAGLLTGAIELMDAALIIQKEMRAVEDALIRDELRGKE